MAWKSCTAIATSAMRSVAATVTNRPQPKRQTSTALVDRGSDAWKSIGIGIQRRYASVMMLQPRMVPRIAGEDSG